MLLLAMGSTERNDRWWERQPQPCKGFVSLLLGQAMRGRHLPHYSCPFLLSNARMGLAGRVPTSANVSLSSRISFSNSSLESVKLDFFFMPSFMPPKISTCYADGVMTIHQRTEMSLIIWRSNQKTPLILQWWNLKTKQGRAYDVKTVHPWWSDVLRESTLKWKEGSQPKEPL